MNPKQWKKLLAYVLLFTMLMAPTATTAQAAELNGVDYSAVFDAAYYAQNNADVVAVFGNSEEALLQHFVGNGMAEGRQANAEFNVYTYLSNYEDIAAAFGSNLAACYMHYITEGKAEGRNASTAISSGSTPSTPSTPSYNAADYSAVFDAAYYAANHADIAAAFGSDTAAMLAHFVENGMAEGRQANAEFNVYTYLSNYADIAAAFGSDLKSCYLHYISAGKAEGRNAATAIDSGSTPSTPSAPSYNASDYAAVFDAAYYAANHADIAAAFGNDTAAMLAHFVENGMAEGRQANAEFNVYTYLSNYADIAAAFGSDLKSCYLHYISAGKAEGRNAATAIGSGSTPSTPSYNAADYAAVFDAAYYAANHADIAAAFGNDAAAMLAHFVENGMAEGRQANAEFNVYIYLSNYADIAAAFGSDLVACYMHYITNGQAEGRNAATAIGGGSTTEPVTGDVSVSSPAGGTFVVTCNENGQMTTQVHLDANGTTIGYNNVEYNEEGQLVQISCYDTEGDFLGEIMWDYFDGAVESYEIYAPYGDVAAVTAVSKSGATVSAEFLSLKKGYSEFVYYDTDGISKTVSSLDESGKWLKSWYYYNGVATGYALAAYNADGQLVREDEYNNEDVLERYTTYEYHDNGRRSRITYYDTYGINNYNVYDENGIRIEYGKYYYSNGKENYHEITNYNEKRVVIKQVRYNPDNSIVWYTVYERNENGKVTKEIRYKADGVTIDSYTVYEYHANGRQSAVTDYTGNNTITSQDKYDVDGDIISRYYRTIYSSGEVTGWWLDEYDENEKLIKETRYLPDGTTIDYINAHEYNEKGLEAKQTRYAADGTTVESYWTYEYNDNNKIVKESYFSGTDTTAYEITTYEYHANGVLSKETEAYGDGRIISINGYNEQGIENFYAYYWYSAGVYDGHSEEKYAVIGDAVVTIEEIEYDANRKQESRVTYEYNAAGDISKETCYNANNEVEYYEVYEYNESGQITKTTEYDASGIMNWCEGYEYNENGKLAKQISYDANGEVEDYIVYTYNEAGKTASKMYYDADGDLMRGYEYTYHANGRVASEAYINSNGNVTRVYYYNEIGRTIGEKEYSYKWVDGDYVLSGYSVIKKDDNGRELSETTYDAEGNVTGSGAYAYDQNGRQIEYVYTNSENVITERIVTKYHANGEKAAKEYYIEYGLDYSYTYYENGNKKEYKKCNYQYNEETGKYELASTAVEKYNEAGQQTEDVLYDADGNVVEYSVFSYDAAGRLTESVRYAADGETIVSRTIQEWHTNGQLAKKEEHKSYGMTYYYVYYENGNWKERGVYNYQQDTETDEYTLQSYNIYKYNEAEALLESTTYNADDSVRSANKYTRYENNKIKEQWSYTEDRITSYRKYYENDENAEYIRYYYKQTEDGTYVSNGTYVYKYNENGDEIEYTQYDGENNVTFSRKTEYTYNEAGKYTSCIVTDKDGNVTSKKTFSYYESGDLEEEQEWQGDRIMYIRKYYDDGGQKEYTCYSYNRYTDTETGEYYYVLSGWYIYQYDENGNETAYLTYNASGELNYSEQYTYDENDNLIEYVEKDAAGNITSREVYTYYANGERASYTRYGEYGISSYREYYENSKYKYYESYSYSYSSEEGKYVVSSKIVHKYNEHGNPTEYIQYDGEGNITDSSKWEYTYDDNDRVTDYKEYDKDGNLSYQRTTTYYASGNEETETISYDGRINYHYKYYDTDDYDMMENWQYSYTTSDAGEYILYQIDVYKYTEDFDVTAHIVYDGENNIIAETYYD